MHGPADCFGKLGVGDRVWRDRIDGPTSFGIVQTEQDELHDVIGVNPRDDMRAIADGTTGKHLEGQDHFLERPAVLAEHDANAQHDRSNTKGFGWCCCFLPSRHDIGEKSFATR